MPLPSLPSKTIFCFSSSPTIHHKDIKVFIMKFLVFLAIVAVAVAQRGRAPAAQKPEDVTIVRSESENNGDGTYKFLWETSDGSKHEESGYLKPNPDSQAEYKDIQVSQGSYQYYAPEGDLIQVQYVADENGFQPTGEHLPTSPPIPAEIQKALDIIYSNIGSAPPAAPAKRPAARPASRRH
ncbi:larval cuticle protein 65Ag1 [Folsomia candida]|uniref:Larval cuticle protein LCP-22 n=1 Tax=Folsomia candida TaxID=158441 RepID=A0A226EHY4_FOLCA|nr:larval cuticle protein 65Ag1 [Folsomia candida]OXA56361.1 Larval cuticle protein LCP-22 [Folsomia candida]